MQKPPVVSSAPAKAKSSHVSVYNNMPGIVSLCVHRKPGEPEVGPHSRRIKFMPGNNRMRRTEWDICMANPSFVKNFTEQRNARTVSGQAFPFTKLELGKKVDHTKEFAEMDAKIAEERRQYES